jgi:hypothetical protein
VQHSSVASASARKPRKRRKRRFSLARFWPGARLRKRWWRAFRSAPSGTQFVLALAAALILFLATNWVYQVMRKPSELFFPVSGALYKTPAETWKEYGSLFRDHATDVVTPDLLAALAQVEGSGNPVVRTYWRWSLRSKPFDLYRPASSAVGMYQITDGTFAEARRYCIHDHVVVEDGPWYELDSCWFNSLYTRTLPSNAVELTSAYLDRNIANTLKRLRIADATLQQKQDLAAVIHLCGAGAGEIYARRRFRLVSGQRCGAHEAQAYVARVNQLRKVFKNLGER